MAAAKPTSHAMSGLMQSYVQNAAVHVAAAAVLSLLLVTSLGPRAAAAATEDNTALLQLYRGDGSFLNAWGNNFVNMPGSFWNGQANPVCPTGNWVGVTCQDVANGTYATSIDLSMSSLPSGSRKIIGTFGWEVAGLLFLESINVAGNLLEGPLPAELSLAPALHSLDVENNRLSGNLSSALCSLNLKCLHLANNSFTGAIPTCWRKFPCLDFEGNKLTIVKNVTCLDVPYKSCPPNTTVVYAPPPPPYTSSSGGVNTGAIVGGVVGGLVLLALIAAGVLLWMKHQERERKREEERLLAENIEAQVTSRHFGALSRYSSEQLATATNSFDADNLLGEGGYSRVYKGKLEDGKTVAVKRIKDEKKAGGELAFLTEVELISRAVHRNLMHIYGFCVERGECMLVTPYYSNGSVALRTQQKQGNPLDWNARKRIALGAAEGIAYLHTDCNPKLIHRDIKADNVLLTEEDEAVIADFGLAKEMDVRDTHATTNVKGTIGHIAPEYFVNGSVSDKTDVYAFGVFLLELLSGRDVFDLSSSPELEEMGLRDWVAKVLKEGGQTLLDALVDPELPRNEKELPMAEVEKMLQVALMCISTDPADRPTMVEAAKLLSGTGLAEKWEKWQAEAGTMKAEDLLNIVNTPAIWDNMTTGISLDAYGISGPR